MTTSLARLREVVQGEVLEPGMPGYEAARRPAMTRFWHFRPRAVVRCASAADVARALAFARHTGLPVVPRGGGHCFAGRSSTDGIVLDLTPLRPSACHRPAWSRSARAPGWPRCTTACMSTA